MCDPRKDLRYSRCSGKSIRQSDRHDVRFSLVRVRDLAAADYSILLLLVMVILLLKVRAADGPTKMRSINRD